MPADLGFRSNLLSQFGSEAPFDGEGEGVWCEFVAVVGDVRENLALGFSF